MDYVNKAESTDRGILAMSQDKLDMKIRDLPVEVRDLMKERAKRNFRSLNGQIVADLQDAANHEYAKQQEEGAE